MKQSTRKVAVGSYLPVSLVEGLDRHLKATGQSKAAFFEDAVAAWLTAQQRIRGPATTDASGWTTVRIPPHPDAEQIQEIVFRLCQPGALEQLHSALAMLLGDPEPEGNNERRSAT